MEPFTVIPAWAKSSVILCFSLCCSIAPTPWNCRGGKVLAYGHRTWMNQYGTVRRIFVDRSRRRRVWLDQLELGHQACVEQMNIRFAHEGDKTVRFGFGDDELHQYRHVTGELEEMLFVQAAVAAEAGNRAKRRAAVDAKRLCLLQQPLVDQITAVFAVFISVK